MDKRIEFTKDTGRLPGFRYAGRKFCLLNSGLDVEADGITYPLASEFSSGKEMDAVIDAIELERNRCRKLLL